MFDMNDLHGCVPTEVGYKTCKKARRFRNKFAKRVFEWRTYNNISKSELAEKSGVPEWTIDSIERGSAYNRYSIMELGRFLGMDIVEVDRLLDEKMRY